MTGWTATDLIAALTRSPATLVLSAAAIVLVYLVILVRMLRRRRTRTAEAAAIPAVAGTPAAVPNPEPAPAEPFSLPDPQGPMAHAVPAWASARGRITFLLLSAVVCVGLWVAALYLSPDRARFFASKEWHAQPFYLFAHAAALRIFASLLTKNFILGASSLDADPASLTRRVRGLLSLAMPIGALLIAAPFALLDLRYFLSDAYPKLSAAAEPSAADWIMFGIWSIEWLLNAMVWMLLVGFLVLNVSTLRRHRFRAPVHLVLAQRQYRPFLSMSAQGATVAFVFSLATALYIVYAGGEITDYVGLIITIALLPFCFVPPWIVVRLKVDALVEAETESLNRRLSGHSAQPGAPADGAAVARELAEGLAMLRLMHIERLHDSVGRREAAAIIVRLVAPAATIGWQLWQNSGVILKRVMSTVGIG